jgi:hypothetical protein
MCSIEEAFRCALLKRLSDVPMCSVNEASDVLY